MKVVVGISNHHVHLTKEDMETLFGKGFMLEKKQDLKQPHNYASTSVVTIKTDKSQIENVRVLGELRDYTQVEISKTDAVRLGINPPIRESGDIENSSVVTIIGPVGEIKKACCILAQRHIHITKELKEKYHLKDVVSLKVSGQKGGILDNVYLKVSKNAYFECHLDTDEGNAFFLKTGDEVEIIKSQE